VVILAYGIGRYWVALHPRPDGTGYYLRIKSEEEMMMAIEHIHFESHKMCKDSYGEHFQVAGKIGIFCHYGDEFEFLKKVREALCYPSDNKDQKYFELKNPIIISAKKDIPETKYTHLYTVPFEQLQEVPPAQK
jgi:hypothetical protein